MSDIPANQYVKIASAIYLITGFFTNEEPLKWRLRSLSTDLVGGAPKDKAALSREVVALLGLARAAGLVSETNHDILSREVSRLTSEEEAVIHSLLNEVPSPRLARSEAMVPPPPAPLVPSLPTPVPPPIKDISSQSSPEHKPVLKEFGAVSVKKNSRQSTIIALLKRKKEIMIKDVSPLIAGCSEKTIQRELLEMVSQGIVRKIGEKRWTRYTLA